MPSSSVKKHHAPCTCFGFLCVSCKFFPRHNKIFKISVSLLINSDKMAYNILIFLEVLHQMVWSAPIHSVLLQFHARRVLATAAIVALQFFRQQHQLHTQPTFNFHLVWILNFYLSFLNGHFGSISFISNIILCKFNLF